MGETVLLQSVCGLIFLSVFSINNIGMVVFNTEMISFSVHGGSYNYILKSPVLADSTTL